MKVGTLSKEILVEINREIPYKTADGLAAGGDANLNFAVYRTGRARGINRKASVLMKSIIESHPFLDGNKRTGFIAAKALLEINGKTWGKLHEYTKESFTREVATTDIAINEMAKWFANHTVRK